MFCDGLVGSIVTLFYIGFPDSLVFFNLLFWSSELFFTSTYPSSLSLFLRKKETVQNSPKASNRGKSFRNTQSLIVEGCL